MLVHAKKKEEGHSAKQKLRNLFYAWVMTPSVQQLVNTKYRKGLFVKYE